MTAIPWQHTQSVLSIGEEMMIRPRWKSLAFQ
jgi:hypothetical protein